MQALFMQGFSIEELEALIRKVIKEEVCSYFVELEGKKVSPQPCNKTQFPDKEEYLTRKETAALLKISLVTLYNWTNQGRLTSYSIGTRVRYKADEVNNALIEIKSTKYQRK